MMAAVAKPPVPPFERFYAERRDEVFRYLRRLLGQDGADDAFQETFLRALRAYPCARPTSFREPTATA